MRSQTSDGRKNQNQKQHSSIVRWHVVRSHTIITFLYVFYPWLLRFLALIIIVVFSIPRGCDHLIDLLMVIFLLITIVFFCVFHSHNCFVGLLIMVPNIHYYHLLSILHGHDCLVGLLIMVFGIHCSHHFFFSLFFFCCDCLVGFLVMVNGALWEIKWFAINLVIGFLSYNDHLHFFAFVVSTILFCFFVMIVSLVFWSWFLVHYKK
jgi:hypothetical protein